MRYVSIKLDGNETVVSIEAFRRILNSARGDLSGLRFREGGSFPKIDKAALAAIESLQFDHRELV